MGPSDITEVHVCVKLKWKINAVIKNKRYFSLVSSKYNQKRKLIEMLLLKCKPTYLVLLQIVTMYFASKLNNSNIITIIIVVIQ